MIVEPPNSIVVQDGDDVYTHIDLDVYTHYRKDALAARRSALKSLEKHLMLILLQDIQVTTAVSDAFDGEDIKKQEFLTQLRELITEKGFDTKSVAERLRNKITEQFEKFDFGEGDQASITNESLLISNGNALNVPSFYDSLLTPDGSTLRPATEDEKVLLTLLGQTSV